MMKKLHPLLLSLALSFGVHALKAQDEAPPITLENVHNAVLVHLYYLQPDSYDPAKAAAPIHPSVRDSLRRIRLAVQIKQVLDGMGLYVRLNQLPQKNDYVDTTSGQHVYTLFPREAPEIYLERVDGRWYYSRQTVQAIPALHKKVYPFGADLLLNLLPEMGQRKWLGLYLWQYAGMLLIVVLVLVLHFFLSRMIRPVVRRLSRSRLREVFVEEKLIWRVSRLASVWILLQFVRLLLPSLQLPIRAAHFVMTGLKIAGALILMLLLLRILDIVIQYTSRLTARTESKLDDQLVPILRKMMQVLIVLGALLQIMHLLEVNVTAIIAGVSIGGLALALAAQDTVKNFIGSVMIFIDQPFQIGDWIEGDGIAGSVVEVGLRSTRIQQVDSSIIAVPNGNIANMAIKNLGVRVYRLINFTLGVTYDTPPALLELFIEGLKGIIRVHPKTAKEGWYVHFTQFADSSLNILFRTPVLVQDYASELAVREEISLAILRLAETLGVSFAFPSTSVYVESFPGKEIATATPEPRTADLQTRLETFLEEWKKQLEAKGPDA